MEPIRKASTIMGGLIIAAFACRGSWIACSYRMPDIFHLRISEPWLPHASNRRMTGSLATQCHSHTNELFKALSEALTSSTGQFELELWIVALPRVQWGCANRNVIYAWRTDFLHLGAFDSSVPLPIFIPSHRYPYKLPSSWSSTIYEYKKPNYIL